MDHEPVHLTLAEREVAVYHDGTDLTPDLSPRPYLHPVLSPAGVVVTETWPEDHRHHYGVSAAVVDIDGVTYWGGKSYVGGEGYVMLPNQGTQVGGPVTVDGDDRVFTDLRQQLSWRDPDGTEQLTEERDIRVGIADAGANLLTWRSTLKAGDADLTIGSPATRGRTGAGYGGLFWRVGPEAPTTVRVATADGVVTGEENALGAVGRWLTLTQHREAGPVTLLLGQPVDDLLPWFVRVSGYVGAGPAIAWADPVPFPRGSTRDLHLWGAVVDADLDPASADTVYEQLEHLAA